MTAAPISLLHLSVLNKLMRLIRRLVPINPSAPASSRQYCFRNLQGTKPSSSDAMIFYPTKDLVGEKVVSARVPACELYYGGWIVFVASITLTIVDSAAQRNLISGTLIVLLIVSAVGLWVTAWGCSERHSLGTSIICLRPLRRAAYRSELPPAGFVNVATIFVLGAIIVARNLAFPTHSLRSQAS